MARNKIDGDQVQEETLTGDNVLDGSLRHEDLESYSFATLDDVQLSPLESDDFVVFNFNVSKFVNEKIFNINLFIKRTFSASEDINIPADKVLQMHSPRIDGELYIDGEVYIL